MRMLSARDKLGQWEVGTYLHQPGSKRKEFNVYAETKKQAEFKLAEMIVEKRSRSRRRRQTKKGKYL